MLVAKHISRPIDFMGLTRLVKYKHGLKCSAGLGLGPLKCLGAWLLSGSLHRQLGASSAWSKGSAPRDVKDVKSCVVKQR